MSRFSNNHLGYRQPPSSVDNYKTFNEHIVKPTSTRTSRHSPPIQDDEMDNDNRTIRRLVVDQPLNPSRSRSPSHVSLNSMVIEGQWRYRGNDDDDLRLKSMGIGHLVPICHDIMSKTFELINHKQQKPKKSSSTNASRSLIQLDEFRKLTNADKNSLRRAKLLDLMTIVYEAVTTDVSISQLVRIWHEVTEHNLRPRRSKSSNARPLISYETTFGHLIRKPDDQLLQIALHASLISTQNRSDLQRIGDKLGIKRSHFDMNTIRDSTKAFQNLIKLLREQKIKQKQERKYIDTTRLPYDKSKKKRSLYVNVSGTKFTLIRQAVDAFGFSISPDSDFTCNLLWNDSSISMDIVSALKPYQKVNHFPTMNEISRKDLLAKNFHRLSHFIPNVYNFAPRTWILPNEYNLWYSEASNKPKLDPSVYIVKPTNRATGDGIEIYCDYKEIRSMDNYIIQEYIREPYLIDGFKFDLRIYVLITSCDPLRVFIFKNGLVCMSSKKYEIPNKKNVFNLHMHLTNYAMDEDDDLDTDNKKKHSLKYLFDYLKVQKQDVDKLWKEIQNIVLKTVFLVEPHILNSYRQCRSGALPSSESVCFELLGFDILIDKKLKPWIIEVNRCPSFDMNEQIDFDIKIKLLLDTFGLLRFRASDRKKSIQIEKIEAQRRLYSSIGKHTNNRTHELDEMKENLYLLRREKAREIFESHHSGGFVRLFPVEDENQMNDLMNILSKCFQVLYTNKNDLSWDLKYYNRYNEQELIKQLIQLENIHQTDRQESLRLTDTPNSSLVLSRASPSTCFTFESSDEDERSRSKSPRSDTIRKSTSSTYDSYMRKASTQTPPDILRSISLSSLNTPKHQPKSLVTTGIISRPQADSEEALPGVSAKRITAKKSYSTPSSQETDERPQSHSSKSKKSNHKSQMVTYSSIIQATRQQQTINPSISTHITQELQLTDNDLNRLYQLIFEQMCKLCIHHPNKSDKETQQICIQIMENWDRYKSYVGRFWLVELDTDTRPSITQIVWNNIQQIMKKICILDKLVQELPLNRHFMKLEQRLLANKGQCLWDICQDRHSSWESLFTKSTNHLSTIELDCCYRFVELCKEALFIVYLCSIDEKIHKQRQIDQGLTVMMKS